MTKEQKDQIAKIRADKIVLDRYCDLIRKLQTQEAKVKRAYELSPLPKPTTKEEAEIIVHADAKLAESLREVRKITGCVKSNFPGQKRLEQVARYKGYRGLAHKWENIDWTPSLRKGGSAVAPAAKVVSFKNA